MALKRMLSKMHKGPVHPLFPLVIFMLGLMPLVSCVAAQRGPVVVLPNSYYLRPDKDMQTMLVRRNGRRVLKSHVAAYAVSGYIVAGALGDYRPKHYHTNDLAYTGGADTRYFILDTTTGKLETGLPEAAWRKRLQELGVRSDFMIYPLPPWQPEF